MQKFIHAHEYCFSFRILALENNFLLQFQIDVSMIV